VHRQLFFTQPPDGPETSSYLKLQWALHHLETLQAAVDGFLSRQPYPVRSDPDAESGGVLYRAVIPEQPDPSIGLMIGDVVHNLRAVFDHLVGECVVLNGGAATDDTAFPVSHDAEWFERVAVRKMLAGTAPEFIEEVRRAQPHGGEDPKMHLLYTLNELDIIDKHRAVLPTAGIVAQPEFVQVPGKAEQSSERPRYFGWGVRDGDPVLFLPDAYVEPGLEPKFSRKVGIDVPLPRPSWDIVDRLYALYQFTDRERARLKWVAMGAAQSPPC
jgi:hypothetical protein